MRKASVRSRRTWLWVLGWLLIFPLPLTAILLRKRQMKPLLKYGIIGLAWLIYLIFFFAAASGSDHEEPQETRSVAVDTVKSVPKSEPEPSPEPEPETEPEPEPEPVEVTGISIGAGDTELILGAQTELTAKISPDDADDKTVKWESSDAAVCTVSSDGTVTAVGGGSATITATSANGLEDTVYIVVDGSTRVMKLDVTRRRNEDVNIGDEWTYVTLVNGSAAARSYELAVGDELSFEATFTEQDSKPDVGSGKATHTVTEEDLLNGFEVELEFDVTENGGKNAGKSAHCIVTYRFSA